LSSKANEGLEATNTRPTYTYSQHIPTKYKLLHDVSYGGTHSTNSQAFGDWGAEEKRMVKWKGS